MTAGRGSLTQAQFEQLVADYLAGDPLRVVAARYNRSSTWVRETLERLGVPRRPRGGVQEPVSTEEIVRLRDEECLSWSEIGAVTGLTEEALRTRYRSAQPTGPARRYNRDGASTDEQIWRRNDAANHLEEIRAAYAAGHTINDLSTQWGVPARTILAWVREDRLA